MVKRLKIGIGFEHSDNWIGGTYYFQNLVSSFESLPAVEQPEVIVLSWERSDFDRLSQTGYSRIRFKDLSLPPGILGRIVNAVSRRFIARNIIKGKLRPKDVDVVYPGDFSAKFSIFRQHLHWIPDLQDLYYPEFFSKEELSSREDERRRIIELKRPIVFSSESAESDFRRFFPHARNKTFVVRFAVTHPEFRSVEINELRIRYKLEKPWFIVPNQFWVHKNQEVVLEAAAELLKERSDFLVVFTGKEYDYRSPGYFESLQSKVKSLSIGPAIRFLGFIDRRDQLKLMSESLAVIQPSLFEGWSTVVEDAKSIGQHIIASDIAVHREQLGQSGTFFNPKDPVALAHCMKNVLKGVKPNSASGDYRQYIQQFARGFIGAVRKEIITL